MIHVQVGAPPRREKPNVWLAFWRSVARFDRDKVAPWLALRNTIGVAAPLLAGVWSGQMASAVVMTTGALNVSFTDGDEPYPVRAKRMLSASFLVGIAVFAGSAAGRYDEWVIVLAGLWAFAAGMLVALGSPASDLGVISLATLVVYAATPQPPERAFYAGLLALAGGLVQTGSSLALWPFRRHGPERRALSALFLELGRSAALPAQIWDAPPASAQSTRAQHALASLATEHSEQAERFRLLLSQAERLRLGLLTLARLRTRLHRERPNGREVEIVDRYFATASRVLPPLGNSILGNRPPADAIEPLQELHELAGELRESLCGKRAEGSAVRALCQDARVQMDAANGQLDAALDLASNVTPAGLQAFARLESRRPWKLRLSGAFATLRANLTLDSAACRHAIRLAVCVGLGETLGRALGLHRAYWLPMTIAIVLKPDFTATFSRGLLRLAGTFAGLAAATGLVHALAPGRLMEVALMAGFVFLLRCVGSANYGIFVMAVTGLVVLLFAAAGIAPQGVIAARAANTAIGGTIALLAYGLWPTWERTQVPETMAGMLDAYREYFRRVKQCYLAPGEPLADEMDGARLAARLARSNLEASVDRLIGEPGTPAATVAALTGILASSHRMVHAMMALEAGLWSSNPVPARPAFRSFANLVEVTLHSLAGALRGSVVTQAELADLREAHHDLIRSGDGRIDRYALVNIETDRITNSLNTLGEEILAWTDGRRSA